MENIENLSRIVGEGFSRIRSGGSEYERYFNAENMHKKIKERFGLSVPHDFLVAMATRDSVPLKKFFNEVEDAHQEGDSERVRRLANGLSDAQSLAQRMGGDIAPLPPAGDAMPMEPGEGVGLPHREVIGRMDPAVGVGPEDGQGILDVLNLVQNPGAAMAGNDLLALREEKQWELETVDPETGETRILRVRRRRVEGEDNPPA